MRSGGVIAAIISAQPMPSIQGGLNVSRSLTDAVPDPGAKGAQSAGDVMSPASSPNTAAHAASAPPQRTAGNPQRADTDPRCDRLALSFLTEDTDPSDADFGGLGHRISRHQRNIELVAVESAREMQAVDDPRYIENEG